jgi:hypothetical protein
VRSCAKAGTVIIVSNRVIAAHLVIKILLGFDQQKNATVNTVTHTAFVLSQLIIFHKIVYKFEGARKELAALQP